MGACLGTPRPAVEGQHEERPLLEGGISRALGAPVDEGPQREASIELALANVVPVEGPDAQRATSPSRTEGEQRPEHVGLDVAGGVAAAREERKQPEVEPLQAEALLGHAAEGEDAEVALPLVGATSEGEPEGEAPLATLVFRAVHAVHQRRQPEAVAVRATAPGPERVEELDGVTLLLRLEDVGEERPQAEAPGLLLPKRLVERSTDPGGGAPGHRPSVAHEERPEVDRPTRGFRTAGRRQQERHPGGEARAQAAHQKSVPTTEPSTVTGSCSWASSAARRTSRNARRSSAREAWASA